ncbi:MAG: hypothetical protein GY737_02400 [Desulfobacteraceae bacterium]|nr:hypothetical protein [Desulfobacteraceae bacterium]
MKQTSLQYSALILTVFLGILMPGAAHATQMHSGSEGIIVHQLGHIFFLLSMVTLIFTINARGLDRERGWRLIQYSALFFILWNMVALAVHFLDNQIAAVDVQTLSVWQIRIDPANSSRALANFYYLLKLDHLLCVPAIALFYRGLSKLLAEEEDEI